MFTSFKNIPKVKCFDVEDEGIVEHLQPITSEYLSPNKKRNKSEGRVGGKTNREKVKNKI